MLKRRRTLRSAGELIEAGLIAPEERETLGAVARRYAVAVTPALSDLIDPRDPGDPIARQFVPNAEELMPADAERPDPIGDGRHSPLPGIVHRHRDRVLFKLTHICPVYCRFCFRREMVGPTNGAGLSKRETEAALGYIATHPEIWEVILTGGDPFVLAPRKLADIAQRLGKIAHVKVLRWHTRMPIADPDAVTGELVRALTRAAKTSYVVVHVNHPREFTPQARAACARLGAAKLPLLSQSVLLRGVNDDIDTLEALMRALVETGVKPYYLHHADLAPGTSHFRTTIAKGEALMRELRARASGLCLPAYVLDIPGGYAKARLERSDAEPITAENGSAYRIRDGEGERHTYRDSVTPPMAG